VFREIFTLDEINSILRNKDEKVYSKGDCLIHHNDISPKYMFFVSKGVVVEE
jgi:hypothetical protein